MKIEFHIIKAKNFFLFLFLLLYFIYINLLCAADACSTKCFYSTECHAIINFENHEMSPLFQLCKNLNSHSNLSIFFVPINIFPELNRLLWSCNRKINSHVPSYSQLNSISLPPNKIDLYAVC